MARIRPDLFRAGYAIREGAGGVIATNPMGNEWFYKASDLEGRTGNGKSPDTPADTLAEIFAQIGRGDTVYIYGGVYETLTGPRVADVSLVGVAPYTRHDKTAQTLLAAVERGGAAIRPASGVTASPNLIIHGQGWRLANLLIVAPSGAEAIRLLRTAEDDSQADASHASFLGCRFISGSIGLQDSGGCSHIKIMDCEFDSLTDAIEHITGAGIAGPNRWRIEGNWFNGNTDHIVVPLSDSRIVRNIFDEATVNIDLRGGLTGANHVVENTFQNTQADITESDGYYGNANDTDVWRNYSTDTAGMTVGVPA